MKSSHNSPVHNLAELHAEIRRVEQNLRKQEESLIQRLHHFPGEAAKTAAAAILPVIIGNEMAASVVKLVKGGFALFTGKSRDEVDGKTSGWKETLLGGAKQLGIFSALRLLLGLWKGK